MKKSIKRLKGFLCLALVLIVFTACGTTNNDEKKSDSTKNNVANEEKTNDKEQKTNDKEEKTLNFPKDKLKIIVPGGAGGGMDINARTVAKYLEKEIGATVIVENRPGAGGIVGATEYLVEQANSDTIIVLPSLVNAVAPLYTNVPYKGDDFVPIIGLNQEVNAIFANPKKTGIETFEDLVEYSKEHVVKFGSGGPGTYNFLAQDALYKMADIQAETVPHKSGAEGLTNVLGGHTDITLAPARIAKDYVENGDLKPLFVFSQQPYDKYEGVDPVPTIMSKGYDVQYEGYVYIATRKGTDQEIIDYLYDSINKVYQNPDFKAELVHLNINNSNGKEVNEYMKSRTEDAKKFYEIANPSE
ncbi:MAG: tripartite tricarboxylate transporter substrate-binding protein [Vallitalea sp.]|jgi:tripartite-type tricarboxylate transporter receptor subunit TctC|nr:tripartite tricarboxylate transporter substrate-binding protein [Vallitalea sp.]